MGWHTSSLKRAFYQQFPKVDLHRHLEGSLRIETLLELAVSHGIKTSTKDEFYSLVQVQQGDPLTFSNFLSKFQPLRLFYRSPEVISRIAYEAIEDAAKDNVRYLELRFTPVALSRVEGFPLGDVMDWVAESAQKASADFNIHTRLIASVNRHESPKLAEEVAQLTIDRITKGFVGLDLAGNEAEFSAKPFAPIFKEAKENGLAITIHAGEWGGAENVREAIEDLNADRIGHGVRVLESDHIVSLARERKTPFEVCITSNYQTGAVPALLSHPLTRMMMADLTVTINTDDPSISKINLSNEYMIACDDLSLPQETLADTILTAADAAFLPPSERKNILDLLKQELQKIV